MWNRIQNHTPSKANGSKLKTKNSFSPPRFPIPLKKGGKGVVFLLLPFIVAASLLALPACSSDKGKTNSATKTLDTPNSELRSPNSSPQPDNRQSSINNKFDPANLPVMTKEELDAYIKRKGIKPITKANFKEPQLLMDINLGKDYNNIYPWLSEPTKNGNVIGRSDRLGPRYGGKVPSAAFYFINAKGELTKKIDFTDEDNTFSAIRKKLQENGKEARIKTARTFMAYKGGGYAAALENEYIYTELPQGEGPPVPKSAKHYLSYFDEYGNLLWKKEVNGEFAKMSPDGKYMVIQSGNPFITVEGIAVGVNLNVNRFKIMDYRGEEILEYKGFAEFRDFRIYGFTGNSAYFYAETAKVYDQQYDGKEGSQHYILLYDLNKKKMILEKPREEILGNYRIVADEPMSYDGKFFFVVDNQDDRKVRLVDIQGKQYETAFPPEKYKSEHMAWNFINGDHHYLYLEYVTNYTGASGEYHNFLYDTDDLMTALSQKQFGKSLGKYDGYVSLQGGKALKHKDTKEVDLQTLLGLAIEDADIPAFRESVTLTSLYGEELWQADGEGSMRRSQSNELILRIDKVVNGERHAILYKIPEQE